ncbi:MAG TPA: hypothetical protein VGE06_00620, partial [Flavisolibacter sp.]
KIAKPSAPIELYPEMHNRFDPDSDLQLRQIEPTFIKIVYECGEITLKSDGTYSIKETAK